MFLLAFGYAGWANVPEWLVLGEAPTLHGVAIDTSGRAIHAADHAGNSVMVMTASPSG